MQITFYFFLLYSTEITHTRNSNVAPGTHRFQIENEEFAESSLYCFPPVLHLHCTILCRYQICEDPLWWPRSDRLPQVWVHKHGSTLRFHLLRLSRLYACHLQLITTWSFTYWFLPCLRLCNKLYGWRTYFMLPGF